jgi:dephospho-CoA kinase
MYIVFVTGGLASGKQTVCEYLHSKGASYLDLDAIAKDISNESAVSGQIQEQFGSDIIGTDGKIQSKLLAQRAFASRESADKLNAIVWPAVQERLADLLIGASCQQLRTGDLVVVEIPMLAEAPDFMDLADEIIAVAAPEQLRLSRAVTRGISREDASSRMALQATDEQRAAISDVVFDNSGSLTQLYAQVDAWLQNTTAMISAESLF